MPRPKRNVLASADEASSPPLELPPSYVLGRVIKAQGNNLFSVTLPNQDELLVELAAKLRSTFWIKRGSYVVVDTEALAERDNKLGGEIVVVIMHEKEWRKMPYWPKEFVKRNNHYEDDDVEDDSTVGKIPPSDSEDEG